MGFSIFGRVVDEQGKGVGNVQISIDGKTSATTNDQG
jgi:hypothetical protein